MRPDMNLGVLLAGALFGGLMLGYLGVQLFMPLWHGAGMKLLEPPGPSQPGLAVSPTGDPDAPAKETTRWADD